jgi:hypothetical protein
MQRFTPYLFLLAWLLSPAIAGANNLVVMGTAGTYADANGIYQPSTDVGGHAAWKHSDKEYYLYYAEYAETGYSAFYWNLDVNTEDQDAVPATGVLVYSEENPASASPTDVATWTDAANSEAPTAFSVTAYTLNPDINVRGNNVTVIAGNTTPTFHDHTRFGVQAVASGTTSRTYTIANYGATALEIGAITIGGTHAADFTVTSAPASSVAPYGTTSFVVTFDPAAAGDRSATVSIANSDPDESPYVFAISGYGLVAKSLTVSGITLPTEANGTYAYQGIRNNHPYWKHSTLNYYIHASSNGNEYTYAWAIDNNLDFSDGAPFYVRDNANIPCGLSWDKLSFLPTGSSTWENNAAGPPVVVIAAEPEINVLAATSYLIADGASSPWIYEGTHFGSLDIASGSRARTFTINNIGSATLNITSATLSGTDVADFTITTAPATTVAAAGSTTLTISFDPSTVGRKNALLTIVNNDDDETTYTIALAGDGYTPRNLTVAGITEPSAANGTYIYQGLSGEFQYWRHSSGAYYITNNSAYNPHTWDIDTDQDPASYVFRSNLNGETVAPVAIANWSRGTTTYAGTPAISYADPEPEMRVLGNAVTISNGDAAPSTYDNTNFGSASTAAGYVTRTFTIQNAGTAALSLSGTPVVAVAGAHASDFTVTQPTMTSVAAGGSTSFSVMFAPSAAGLRSATLSISSNDADQTPFTFALQGTGLAAAPIVTTQAATNIGTTTATGNGTITSLGYPAVTAHGFCWNTATGPTLLNSNVDVKDASSTGAFTALLTNLVPGTKYYVRAFATNAEGTSYGAEQTFTAAAPNLSVAAATVAIAQTAGSTAQASLSANIGWTASSDQAWLAVAPASGTGDATLTFTAQANPLASTRSATVTVTGTGVTAKTITITQAAGAATLAVSPSITSLAKTAGSTSATVTSNTDWTAQSDQTWLTLSAASGAGDATLTLTATANPTVAERTATITLKATNATTKTITVTQAAGDATLAISPSTANLVKTAASTSATVTSNTDWTAQSDQAWLTVAATSGTGDATLTLTATANPTIAERTATITLKVIGATDQTIVITQAAGDATLAVSQNALTMGKEAGDKSVNVTSNSDWTANSDQTWLTVSSTSGTGDATLTFTAEANTMDAERTATITLKVTNAQDQVITVVQAGNATLTLTCNALDMAKTASNEYVGITSNTTWAATSDQAWLTVAPASGTGDEILTLSAEANATTTERTAIVTLKATGLTDRTITVTQAAGDATLAVASTTASFSSKAGSASATVRSNTAWTATSSQSWLTLSTAAGTGDATLTLTVTANTSASPRTAIITLKAIGAADRTIAVTQSAATTGVAQLASLPTLSLLRSSGAALELGLCNFKHSSLTLELYALDGRKVLARSLGNLGDGMQSVSVDWSMLPVGTYLVTLKGNGQTVVNLQVMKRP